MARTQSEATQLREAKRKLKQMTDKILVLAKERDILRAALAKANQESLEWKQRFDILLAKEPSK